MREGRRASNPARGIHVRGERRRLPHDLLTIEQLDVLYQSYLVGSSARERNKVILGLLVYQAITTGELARLTGVDIDLEGRQVIALHRYIAEVRPELVRRVSSLTTNKRDTDKLLMSAGSGPRISNALSRLMREATHRAQFFP